MQGEMTESHIAYLSAGSNLGDREASLKSALSHLGAFGVLVRRVSSIYETEPVGVTDQPWFLNLAAEVETPLAPKELLASCLAIEARHGRSRPSPGAARSLDLDILLYDDIVIDEPQLRIPHPRMAERRFVLEPLAEIAPELIHPVLRKSIRDLLASCPDPAQVFRHSSSVK